MTGCDNLAFVAPAHYPLPLMKTSWIALGAGVLLGAQALAADFVRVKGGQFERGDERYFYLGTNFWYGMNLGAEEPRRPRRLLRELDRLQALG